jgi:hypothetical protein
VKTFLTDVDTARASIGKEDRFDLHIRTLSRGLDLMNELLKGMKLIEETAVTKRVFGYAGFALDTCKLAHTTKELFDHLQQVERLGEQAGTQAHFLKGVQARQAADLKKLNLILQQLEQEANKGN